MARHRTGPEVGGGQHQSADPLRSLKRQLLSDASTQRHAKRHRPGRSPARPAGLTTRRAVSGMGYGTAVGLELPLPGISKAIVGISQPCDRRPSQTARPAPNPLTSSSGVPRPDRMEKRTRWPCTLTQPSRSSATVGRPVRGVCGHTFRGGRQHGIVVVAQLLRGRPVGRAARQGPVRPVVPPGPLVAVGGLQPRVRIRSPGQGPRRSGPSGYRAG